MTRRMTTGGAVALCGVLALAACATGLDTGNAAEQVLPPDDASADDAPADAPSSRDAACPEGRTGPGCASCAQGFNVCQSACLPAPSNVPEAGCSKGCGAACTDPPNGAATCSNEGSCDFTCAPSYAKSDAGCACAPGKHTCKNGCFECCSDDDCANHLRCTGSGVCTGCRDNWADCNGNPADGCEADLSKDGNCGHCGNSCCGSFCGCGFLGVGGKSCKASGTSYSCQC